MTSDVQALTEFVDLPEASQEPSHETAVEAPQHPDDIIVQHAVEEAINEAPEPSPHPHPPSVTDEEQHVIDSTEHHMHEVNHVGDPTNDVAAATALVVESTVPGPEDKDTEAFNSSLIAEAAAAAVEAAAGVGVDVDVDVTAAANAAALAVEEANKLEEAKVVSEAEAIAKKNENRRKRYREKAEEDGKAGGGAKKNKTHEDQLAARRLKDRQRYANMTAEQRQVYNAKRRDQYHRQGENSRQVLKRRERERVRYHSLSSDEAKERNRRRAKLERERYQRLTAEELEEKNRKRRERAAMARQKKEGGDKSGSGMSTQSVTGDSSVVTVAEEASKDEVKVPLPSLDSVKAEEQEVAHPSPTMQPYEAPHVEMDDVDEDNTDVAAAVKEAVSEAVEKAKEDLVSI